MLSATDFFRKRLGVDGVKLLLIDACIECECDKMTIVYAVEDVDKVISKRHRGDVILWVLTKDMTTQFLDRIIDEDEIELIRDMDEVLGIRKMYHIERMSSGFNVVELKLNK